MSGPRVEAVVGAAGPVGLALRVTAEFGDGTEVVVLRKGDAQRLERAWLLAQRLVLGYQRNSDVEELIRLVTGPA